MAADLEESRRAWMHGRHTHFGDADAPPARLERTVPEPEWKGDPFEEEIRWFPVDDDWDYDDPYMDTPEEDLTDVFDSREVDRARD